MQIKMKKQGKLLKYLVYSFYTILSVLASIFITYLVVSKKTNDKFTSSFTHNIKFVLKDYWMYILSGLLISDVAYRFASFLAFTIAKKQFKKDVILKQNKKRHEKWFMVENTQVIVNEKQSNDNLDKDEVSLPKEVLKSHNLIDPLKERVDFFEPVKLENE